VKNESTEELLSILRSSNSPLATQDILLKVKEKCPDASMSMLVALMDVGVIAGEWIPGKGYFWTLPDSGDSKRLSELTNPQQES
jgi:hypothetical protein